MGVLAPIERYDNAATGLGLAPPPKQGLQLTGQTSDESAVRHGLGLQYKLMQGLQSVLGAPGADGLMGGPWGAVGSLLPGQVIRSGPSAQDIAGQALRSARAKHVQQTRDRAAEYASKGDESFAGALKGQAQYIAGRVHDDPHADLNTFLENRLMLGRETGGGLEDPTDPINSILNFLEPEFSHPEIAAMLKTHHFARPEFWNRLLTPEKKDELFNWADRAIMKGYEK